MGTARGHESLEPAKARLIQSDASPARAQAAASPELDPIEHLCDELRDKAFSGLVFASSDALAGHLEFALREMENDIARVRSIAAWPWIIAALVN